MRISVCTYLLWVRFVSAHKKNIEANMERPMMTDKLSLTPTNGRGPPVRRHGASMCGAASQHEGGPGFLAPYRRIKSGRIKKGTLPLTGSLLLVTQHQHSLLADSSTMYLSRDTLFSESVFVLPEGISQLVGYQGLRPTLCSTTPAVS